MSRAQWLLRGLVVAGTLGAFAATGAAHILVPTVLAVALAVFWAVRPDGAFGPAAIGFVLLALALSGGHALTPSALVVAAGLVLAHVAALLATYVPERAAPDTALVRLWVRRGLLCLLGAAVAFAAAAVGDRSVATWGAAAAVVVAGAVGGLVAVRRIAGDEW